MKSRNQDAAARIGWSAGVQICSTVCTAPMESSTQPTGAAPRKYSEVINHIVRRSILLVATMAMAVGTCYGATETGRSFKNHLDFEVYDLHLVFSNSKGTLDKGKLGGRNDGGGPAEVVAKGDSVDVTWESVSGKGLGKGGIVSFYFEYDVPGPLELKEAYWTDIHHNRIPGVSPSPIPEPETYAMLLAGLGLVGLSVCLRRRTGAA